MWVTELQTRYVVTINDMFVTITEAICFITYEISLRTRTFHEFMFDIKVFKTFVEF